MGIRIDEVKIHRVVVPLKKPFHTKLQHVQERESLLIEVKSGDFIGYGEGVAFTTPWYTEETVKTTKFVLRHVLIPIVEGMTFDHPQEVYEAFRHVRGNRMAKAALDMACWDLYAKVQKKPLYEIYGGQKRAIDAGVVVTWKTEEELMEEVTRAVEEGYRRVKIKIHRHIDPSILQRVIAQFPAVYFFADANGSFSSQSIEKLREFDAIGLRLIEQPFSREARTLYEQWTPKLQTPIALDESIASLEDVQWAIETNAADCIVLKPGRVGGPTESLAIIEQTKEAGLDLWIGGMIEFGISKAHNIALATLEGVTLPGDFSASNHFWAQDLVTPPLTLCDGQMIVSDVPGIGVTLDEQMLKKYKAD